MSRFIIIIFFFSFVIFLLRNPFLGLPIHSADISPTVAEGGGREKEEEKKRKETGGIELPREFNIQEKEGGREREEEEYSRCLGVCVCIPSFVLLYSRK